MIEKQKANRMTTATTTTTTTSSASCQGDDHQTKEATISQCLHTLLQQSELDDDNHHNPINNSDSDLLSPWSRSKQLGCPKKKKRSPRSPQRDKSSPSMASPHRSPLRTRRPATAVGSTTTTTTAAGKSTGVNGSNKTTMKESARKCAKFRGVLQSLLYSERRDPDYISFEHLSDTGQYIENYRRLHRTVTPCQGGSPRKLDTSPTKTSRTTGHCSSPDIEGDDDYHTTLELSRKDSYGDQSTKRCSKSDRGCPHHAPISPCVRTSQSDCSPPRHVTSTSRMAVQGQQFDSSKKTTEGNEAGRNRYRFAGRNRRIIIAENADSRKCKKIYLTWRQYVKYFSRLYPTPGTTRHGSDDVTDDDDMDGCTERPTTPHENYVVQSQEQNWIPSRSCCATPTTPRLHRAATCVPVLDFDQSRVGTPVSPFRVDQSSPSRMKHVQSAPSMRETRQKSAGVDTATKSNALNCTGLRRGMTEGDLLLSLQKEREKEKNFAGRQLTSGNSMVIMPTRPRLAICTVMDIQAAIQELALHMGTSKTLVQGY